MPGEQMQLETVEDFKNRVRLNGMAFFKSPFEYINHCKLAIK
jgi:hypothetical protein